MLLSRREFVSGIAVAGVSLALPRCGYAVSPATPSAVIEETRIISWEKDKYHGWPTLARRANGELLLAYSGREEHACPFGRLELMRSKDGGRTWSWPQVIYDSPVDDRDGGIIETAKGSLLITTVTNDQWEDKLDKADPGEDEARLARWRAVRDRVSAPQRKAEMGSFLLRSTDGGVTWSARQRLPLHSPHGPTQLRDGRLIYPGIARWLPEKKMGVCQSKDDGVTWSEPMILSGDGKGTDLGYPSTVQLDDGSLVTVWYEKFADNPRAQLRQVRWKLA